MPYADLTDPQSLNLYGYVGGNPESKTDADGHCWPLSVCADKLDAYIQVFRDDGLAANKLASSTNTVFLNTFANGVTADLAQGFTNVLRLGQSVGSLPPGASTRDKLIAGSEEGGRVATIILIVVGGEAKGQADANALGREVEAQGTRGGNQSVPGSYPESTVNRAGKNFVNKNGTSQPLGGRQGSTNTLGTKSTNAKTGKTNIFRNAQRKNYAGGAKVANFETKPQPRGPNQSNVHVKIKE